MRLAELNVAYPKYPLDDPRMSVFVENLDRINALAERSPGFVWRLAEPFGDGSDVAFANDPNMIPNLSVWEDVESLGNFTFNTVHARIYERRAEWFETMISHHFVMWRVADDHRPTLDEALGRLSMLQLRGSTEDAFGWDVLDKTPWRRCQEAS